MKTSDRNISQHQTELYFFNLKNEVFMSANRSSFRYIFDAPPGCFINKTQTSLRAVSVDLPSEAPRCTSRAARAGNCSSTLTIYLQFSPLGKQITIACRYQLPLTIIVRWMSILVCSFFVHVKNGK